MPYVYYLFRPVGDMPLATQMVTKYSDPCICQLSDGGMILFIMTISQPLYTK